MNIPLSWLKQAAQITDTTPVMLEKLTAAGNAVESLTRLGYEISNVVVGRINSLTRHPDADKLWVTQTDIGTEVLQIITGADNLKEGDLVPAALHGSTLAGGVKIKKGKMRGLDSNGMLCSIEELGYTIADYPEACADGIYVFPSQLFSLSEEEGKTTIALGQDVCPIMELLEEVAEFDILSNRPDTNSVMGMARELCAVYGQTFNPPQISVKEASAGSVTDMVTVDILDPERCPRYVARVVTNAKIGPSPQWLRRRLSAAGIRPVNNIVDITNYVMLEYGQPLHAFDISAVAQKDGKHHIVVRTATNGEVFTTLDEEERTLTGTTLLIADHTKPIGIAGIMGGQNSKITNDSTTILFESANFNAANIRLTSRALGMRTDASARYEKGQDPNIALTSINRAMELVALLACGDIVPGAVDSYPTPRTPRSVNFTPRGIRTLLGITSEDLATQDMCNYLTRVGIAVADGDGHKTATIPTYRADIAGQADLAEEVARFYGLNNIPSLHSYTVFGNTLHENNAGKHPRRKRQDAIKQSLTAIGYNEALTYPFESPKVHDKLNLDQAQRNAITLKNPLGEDFSVMRTTTIGALLESLARNHNKGNESVALFEIAHSYSQEEYAETAHLTLAAYGPGTSYLTLKGDVEALVSTLTNRPTVYEPLTNCPYMHPGRSATISVKTSPNPRDAATHLGILGELHPTVAKNFGIDTRAYVAILDMEALHSIAEAYRFKFTQPPMFPTLARDFAFKVAQDIPAASLEAAIREKGGQLLAGVTLFDVYQGAQVGDGYKSMAYSLKFRANDKTLAVSDVQKTLDAILANLQKKFGAEVRG